MSALLTIKSATPGPRKPLIIENKRLQILRPAQASSTLT
jgi:hypothetical protein